jgi:hypothetical protein
MMKGLATFVTAIVVASGLAGSAHAQGWASALKGLPITDLTGQIGGAVEWVVGQIRIYNHQIRADSVGRLVIDLSNLAGLEAALADQIDALASNPQDAHHTPGAGGGAVMDSLNRNLNLVRQEFKRVNADLADLDPQWMPAHASLGPDIGSFAHDGALYYCITDCGTNFYTGQRAVQLTDPQQTGQLAAVLRSDVGNIRQIAAAIQSATAQSKATK